MEVESRASDAGARDHRLRRRADFVDARAPDVLALDERSPPTGLSKRPCQRGPGLAGTDDNDVVAFLPTDALMARLVPSI